MANLFVNLPALTTDGVGAGQDTSQMGGEKTITVEDPFEGTVTIEISLDGGTTWGQVTSFTTPAKQVMNFAAGQMRVRRSGVQNASAINVDVSANDNGALFVTPAVPAADGVGAQSNVAAFGELNTVVVSGAFTGVVVIQVSEDGTDWADCMVFTNAGVQSKSFTAQFMRVFRKGTSGTPGTPVVSYGAINDAASAAGGGGGGGVSSCLVFQQGGTETGPVIFNAWADLMERLTTLRANANGGGCYTIQFDSSIATCVVPAGAYDMTNVTWEGTSLGANVQIADGVTLPGMRNWGKRLTNVENQSTAPVVTDVLALEIVNFDEATLYSTGGFPVYDLTALNPGQVAIFVVANGSFLGDLVVNIPTGGNRSLNLLLDTFSSVQDTFLTGVAGTRITPTVEDTRGLPSTLTGFLGTILPIQLANPPTQRMNPAGAASAAAILPASVAFGDWLKLTTASGAIVQELPSINAASGFYTKPGMSIVVSEVSGKGDLTVMPSAGDTINGTSSPYPVPGNGSVVLISDGVSDWRAIAHFGSPVYDVRDIVLGPAAATAQVGDLVQVDPTGGAMLVNLPAVTAGNKGHVIKVKNSSASANNITITPAGADTVNLAASVVLAAAQASAELVSDGGTNWMVTG